MVARYLRSLAKDAEKYRADYDPEHATANDDDDDYIDDAMTEPDFIYYIEDDDAASYSTAGETLREPTPSLTIQLQGHAAAFGNRTIATGRRVNVWQRQKDESEYFGRGKPAQSAPTRRRRHCGSPV